MNTIHINFKNILIVTLLHLLIFSCTKTEQTEALQGESSLQVNLDGLEFESEIDLTANSKNSSSTDEIDQVFTQCMDGISIESRLSYDVESRNQLKNIKSNNMAATKELQHGIKYILLVYNSNKQLVTFKEYTYKQETLQSAISLNSDTYYTFVVVSSRSTTATPTIKNINNLQNAIIENANADLLYWSKTTKLSSGDNYLAAKLRPLFSEVTTTLQMYNTMTGLITSITSPTFHPVANNISLKLLDGTATYGSVNSNGKAIIFPSLGNGVRTVTAAPTTLIHTNTSTASVRFGTLNVDGETKSNIVVPNLSIKPGHRYNLILTLKTCTEPVSGNGFNWEYPQTSKTFKEKYWEEDWRGRLVEKERDVTYNGIDFKPQGSDNTTFVKNGEIITFNFTEKGADYGFVYDITELDNAFNLEVNGTPIVGTDVTTGEIQFQNNATNTTQNIEFEDGSQYQSTGNNNVPSNKRVESIWTLKGTKEKPIVRVVIGRNGDVRLYGSKTSGGELFPLRLKNGLQFNTITWKGGDQTNQIKATSRVEGKTVMKASGSGVKKIKCK